uniref:Endonuclease/exonuclease/phosphatase domain-containing protein n=1 Tax=Chromera velia CCMP2878 TaxID=1169474 RepID=A0A0G4HDW8_9ALVE|eukprot:Cvel_26609.t1-p1 / transcript=Cvel_26609.t1 / gene=Cvel_26609 / organism=Chromera_velia_CCMP2878 / gene_product=hypothetical protein / transcript_product=hypothetical protein / location=Cvel_scaffold3191:10822-17577(+) / protein_length=424 / sequence_SO=supercontig / SO=protein_coding / is_pseudo=false
MWVAWLNCKGGQRGLQPCLCSEEFESEFEAADILFLPESCSSLKECRTAKGKKEGKNFPLISKRGETTTSTGGVAVLLSRRARSVGWEEERLSNAAAIVRHPDLNTPLLCGVCDPCADSMHADDTFLTDLKDRLEEKRREGGGRRRIVSVGGDFNARTGSEAPRLTFGENAGEGVRGEMWEKEETPFRPTRQSKDRVVNWKGKRMISFCEETEIVLINGLRECKVAGDGGVKSFAFDDSFTFSALGRDAWAVNDYLLQKRQEKWSEGAGGTKQPDVQTFFPTKDEAEAVVAPYAGTHEKRIKCDMLTTDFLASVGWLHLTENEALRKLVKALDPRYDLPSVGKVQRLLLPTLKNEIILSIKDRLRKAATRRVSIILDIWSHSERLGGNFPLLRKSSLQVRKATDLFIFTSNTRGLLSALARHRR